MEAPGRVLVVDDELSVRRLLGIYLGKEGYAVAEAANGLDALSLVRRGGIDLALVDVMLPGIDGLELVRRIRNESGIPIILLTARGEEASRVAGLEVGADDYVVKPFFASEVVARVKAQLRRARGLIEHEPLLRAGSVELERTSRRCRVDGREVDLTRREFDLLGALAERPDRVYTRDQLLDRVWGSEYVSPKTVDVHVSGLRRKLGNAIRIEAVRGVGYRLLA